MSPGRGIGFAISLLAVMCNDYLPVLMHRPLIAVSLTAHLQDLACVI